MKGGVTEREEITGLWNLLSLSLVEGENRADFGENPFTNATSATTTRKKLVAAYIVGEYLVILMEMVWRRTSESVQPRVFFFLRGIFRV